MYNSHNGSTKEEEAPCYFVEQFDEDHPTCEQLVFSDPFDEKQAPVPWGRTRDGPAMREPFDGGATDALAQAEVPQDEGLSDEASDSAVRQRRRTRGMYAALHLAHQEQTQRRLSLQRRAGQPVMDHGAVAAAQLQEAPLARTVASRGLYLPTYRPTDERNRREAVHMELHTRRLLEDADVLLSRAAFREVEMQTMRARRSERMELENYCGTL